MFVLAKPMCMCVCVFLFFFSSVFAGRRFFARCLCAAVIRPASSCLLVCLVFSLERSHRCLLALPPMYFFREWLESCLLCPRSLVLFCFVWALLLHALFLPGGSSPCVRVFASVLCVFA